MEKIMQAEKIITNQKEKIEERVRALFYLRNIEGSVSAPIIANALLKERDSFLLRHECAYVLGQLTEESTIDTLLDILADSSHDEITRHECAEALGNFPRSIKILSRLHEIYAKNNLEIPVKESIELALENMQEDFTNEMRSEFFTSKDPAKPFTGKKIEDLEKLFLNRENSLYVRYKALFALRNINSAQAVDILARGFKNEKSDLLKHEIAFVYGQMENEYSIDVLAKVMESDEHDMVLHEAAEALGAIGNERAMEILNKYVQSPIRVVRESVLVAIDIYKCRIDNREYCDF